MALNEQDRPISDDDRAYGRLGIEILHYIAIETAVTIL
jgi:hypothetical protein